jgi:hypothetical protein
MLPTVFCIITSSLVADVWRKQTRGPSGPTAVGHSFARTPREGTEIATAPGRRNLALTHLPPHQTAASIYLLTIAVIRFFLVLHATALSCFKKSLFF